MALRFVVTSSARPPASALLAALYSEDGARSMGFESVRLDCQRHTWPLYRAAGYAEIDDYNDNPFADHWVEKPL